MREYETFRSLSHDIVNSRLRKIVSLASAPTHTEQMTKNLTGEERFLHNRLSQLIHDWRTQILKNEKVEE
jgi:DNA replication initiation complex subunit (GINS family)